MDENALFRDVTVRICGELEIAAALDRAFEPLQRAIPARTASLHA